MSIYSNNPATEKPGMVTAIAVMTLVNGILNILWGLSVTASVVLGTLFIGIICAPVTILPAILGIFEIIYALKLLANPPQPVQPSITIAIMEIITIITGNVLSAIVGILVLVFYNDPAVKVYFARLNGQPIPLVRPVQPVEPIMPVQPSLVELSEPDQPEWDGSSAEPKPEKPKRTSKVTKPKAEENEQPKEAAKPRIKK